MSQRCTTSWPESHRREPPRTITKGIYSHDVLWRDLLCNISLKDTSVVGQKPQERTTKNKRNLITWLSVERSVVQHKSQRCTNSWPESHRREQPRKKWIYLHDCLWRDLLGNISFKDAPAACQKAARENHEELGAVLHAAHNILNHRYADLK